MKTFFVNDAFNKAINDYLKSKDKPEGVLYNSFLVVVIRLLISIYGELDIINPYHIKDELALDHNLMKYGAKKEDIDNLKRLIDGFYLIEKRNKEALKREENIYFIDVQKRIIDLFVLKKEDVKISDSETKEFFDLLYTPGTSNALRLSYNYLNALDVYEVAHYYQEVMKKASQEPKKERKKNLLDFDVYKLFNVSVADLSKMNNLEVDKLNKEIYESLDIADNAMNKDYLLEEKMRMLKINNNPITTGNGYVDILLVMSVIVTTIMVVVIFGTIVF